MSRSQIPGLVDILRTDDPQTIEALAIDDRLDRRYQTRGPWLNRFLLGRLRRVLEIDGHPLPAVAPREDPDRAKMQAALEKRLSALAQTMTAEDPSFEPLAAYVRGDGEVNRAGPLVQEAVGRLFVPQFQGNSEMWEMARLFAAAPRCLNPIRLAWWAATGRIRDARSRLSNAVDHDRAALHSIGIAVHNLERGLKQMRALWANPADRARLTPRAAVARCLFAPAAVLRQPLEPGRADAEDYGADTLVVLELDKARARRPDRDVIFMTNSWSQCPAHAWVPAFFDTVWRRAAEKNETAGGQGPSLPDEPAQEGAA